MNQKLLEDLCRSLAFHAVETETTARFVSPPDAAAGLRYQAEKAKFLIAEAGFDIDELYPPADRLTAYGLFEGLFVQWWKRRSAAKLVSQ